MKALTELIMINLVDLLVDSRMRSHILIYMGLSALF